MKRMWIIAALFLTLIASPVMAKEGLYVGADLGYNNFKRTDTWFDTVDGALGLGLKLGYNFGVYALEAEFIASSHRNVYPGASVGDLKGLSVNFKPYFTLPQDQNQFYMLIGFGLYSFEQDDNTYGDHYEFTGAGANLGLGFEFFFKKNVALNISGIYRFIRYDDVEIDGVRYPADDPSIDGKAGDVLSINLGINYYF